MRELLDQLVGEMVERGIRFEDARHEFDKRFITRALAADKGSVIRTADRLGVHRNTLARQIKQLKIKARPSGS